jgi:uncharacterized protein (TIGR03435 family)
MAAFGQQTPAREFEAATVKPDQQKGPRFASTWRIDPTMLRIGWYSVTQLVKQAYGLKDYQVISKAPSWVETDRFDVEARTAAPATQDEMMQMLRPVLTEHFHLVTHRETRSIAVLLLEVAPHGPKLQPATKTEGANLLAKKDSINAFHLAMDDLADVLGTFITDRPVLNRTGLKGEYQFDVKFAPRDEDTAAGPSIFTALPEQLGLRLEAAKAPIEVLVIDRAERPGEN